MEGSQTTRGEVRERSPSGRNPFSPVSSSEVTLTGLNDVGDVLRFNPRVRQLRRSLVVQVIQEFHLTGVQGLYQLNSHSKLYRLVWVVVMVEGLVPHLVMRIL